MENVPNFGSEEAPDFEASDDSLGKKEKSKQKDKKSEARPKRGEREEAKTKPEPPLEKLSADEKQAVAKDYVRQRGQEVRGELEAAQPAEQEAASLANAALLDQVNERLDAGDVPDGELLDESLAQVAEELGLDPVELDGDELPVEPFEVAQPDLATDSDSAEDLAENDLDSGNDNNNGNGNTGNSGNAANTANARNPGSGGSGGRPPAGGGPVGPNGGSGSGGGNPSGFGARTGANFLLPTPNTLPVPARRHGHAKYVLAGGIVGYLVGRRRGRIKTEEKLLPVQRKLEQEVSGLHDQIAEREAKIRRLAAQKAFRQPALKEQIVSRLEQRRYEKQFVAEHQPAPEKRFAPKTPKPEQLGQLAVLSVESKRPLEVLQQESQPVFRARTAPIEQVLRLAQDIKLEQQDLRQLYEAGRVEQSNLRKIVEAYVRGERYDRLLSESLKPLESQEHLTRSSGGLRQQAADSGDSSRSPHLERLIRSASQPNWPQIDGAEERLRRPPQSRQANGLKVLPVVVLAILALVVAWLILG
jgi:hypothetical protein